MINGRIAINGDFQTNASSGDNTIYYAGKGTIMAMDITNATGSPQAPPKANMISRNIDGTTNGTFPDTNFLGIMSSNKLTIDTTTNITLMGAFYAQDLVEIEPVNASIYGAIAGDRYKMKGTPSVIHVPGIDDAWSNEMRMIGAKPGGTPPIPLSWREVAVL